MFLNYYPTVPVPAVFSEYLLVTTIDIGSVDLIGDFRRRKSPLFGDFRRRKCLQKAFLAIPAPQVGPV